MRRFQILMTVVSLGLVVIAGQALADGPGAGYSGMKVARIRFIDPKLSLIQLSDGMELRVPDHRMLANLTVGEWVAVDFVFDGGDRIYANSIVPAQAGEIPGPAPTAIGGISNHS